MEEEKKIKRERWKLLIRIERLMNGPMIFLGFVWLILLIIELTSGLSPSLETASIVIWIIFILDFLITFIIAPHKIIFLKKNFLTIISLIVPAFRVLRVVRFVRIIRGVRLVKVIGSVNRSIKSLTGTMSKRGFGYMLLLSVIILFAGSAGIYAFERNETAGLNDYGTALWFTGMAMITFGSDYWPKSAEGRMLCFFLALYGFAVLGYITATLATFFIGKDAKNNSKQLNQVDVAELRKEITELKSLLRDASEKKS